MTIMGKSNSLGNWITPYPKNKIIFNGQDGTASNIELKRGIYYIRGQGAGGSGGNNGYHYNGGGGGSGAGFIGNIYIKSNLNLTSIYAGCSSKNTGTNGENSYIQGVLELGGGRGGGMETGIAGAGGIFVFCPNTDYNSKVSIISSSLTSNGYAVSNVVTNHAPGANSVITNNGGGVANGSGMAGKTATMPGAGGAGGTQWNTSGGLGKHGDLLIQYIKQKP